MRCLPPADRAAREILAEALFGLANAWDPSRLRAIERRLWGSYVQNAGRYDAQHGDGAYGVLWWCFSYAHHMLETKGAIEPVVLDVVEAYMTDRKAPDQHQIVAVTTLQDLLRRHRTTN